MIREEALQLLLNVREQKGRHFSCDELLALNTAIDNLNPQPCADAVSRNAVLKLFAKHEGGPQLYRAIMDLPRVAPELVKIADGEEIRKAMRNAPLVCLDEQQHAIDKMLENLWNDYKQPEKEDDDMNVMKEKWSAIDNVVKDLQNEYEQKIKDGFVVTGTTKTTEIEEDGTVTATMWIEFERRDKTGKEKTT